MGWTIYLRHIGITLLVISDEYLNHRIRLRARRVVLARLLLLILWLVVEDLVHDGAPCANYSSCTPLKCIPHPIFQCTTKAAILGLRRRGDIAQENEM